MVPGGSPPLASPASISFSNAASDRSRDVSVPSRASSKNSGSPESPLGNAVPFRASPGPRYECATGCERSERVRRSISSSRSASRSSASASPVKTALDASDSASASAASSAAAACRRANSARASAAAACWVCRSVSCADAALERPAHPFIHRLRLRRSGSHGGLLGSGNGPREEEPGDEHTHQCDPRLRDDATGQCALGWARPLLPAAHRSPSLGSNRQRVRLSPICNQPSPSTWRAM